MTAAGIRPSPWRRELSDLGRGVAGAFLFGVPFLYTMEVWWTGNFTSPPRMLVALALTYGTLVALDAATGFRSQRSTALRRTLADSIEALALGLVCATAGLVLLRRLTPAVGLEAAMGRIVLLGLPFGIGVGVANGLLRRVEGEGDEQEGDSSPPTDEPQGQDYSIHGTLVDGGAAVLGATVVALAIAPTEEVPLIAAGLSGPWLLAVILASLALSYVIVFQAGFGSQKARRSHEGISSILGARRCSPTCSRCSWRRSCSRSSSSSSRATHPASG